MTEYWLMRGWPLNWNLGTPNLSFLKKYSNTDDLSLMFVGGSGKRAFGSACIIPADWWWSGPFCLTPQRQPQSGLTHFKTGMLAQSWAEVPPLAVLLVFRLNDRSMRFVPIVLDFNLLPSLLRVKLCWSINVICLELFSLPPQTLPTYSEHAVEYIIEAPTALPGFSDCINYKPFAVVLLLPQDLGVARFQIPLFRKTPLPVSHVGTIDCNLFFRGMFGGSTLN